MRSLATLACALALTCIGTLTTHAQDTTDTNPDIVKEGKERGKGKRGKRGRRLARLFKKLDANNDGVLTTEELGKRAQRAARLDLNKDGSITKEEAKAAMQAMREKLRAMTPEERQALRQERVQKRMEKLQQKDTNGDGQLSAEEAPRLVKRFDKNGDGVVTQAEIAEQVRKKRGARGKRFQGRAE